MVLSFRLYQDKSTASAGFKRQMSNQAKSFLVYLRSKFSRCSVCKGLGYFVIVFLSYISSQENYALASRFLTVAVSWSSLALVFFLAPLSFQVSFR